MAITTFAPVGQWLGATPLSQAARSALRATSWLAPLDETLHILALTALFASAAVLHLRLLGVVGRDRPLGPLARKLLPLTWGALAVLLLTGGLLVLNRPARYFRSDMFVIKMGMVLLAAIWTLALQIGFSREARFWEMSPGRRMLAKSGAAVALVLWSGALICGRWIAYA
jgi:hypothetical protein